jgi:hypothetical protein
MSARDVIVTAPASAEWGVLPCVAAAVRVAALLLRQAVAA